MRRLSIAGPLAIVLLLALVPALPAPPPGSGLLGPRVIATDPPDGAVDVNVSKTTIHIDFDQEMEFNTTVRAFSIDPPGNGISIGALGYTHFHFISTAEWQFNTTYTFTVHGTARNVSGAAMGYEHVIRFTTEGPPKRPLDGVVADENGEPQPNSLVEARDLVTGEVVASGYTDENGEFQLLIPEGRRVFLRIVLPDGTEKTTGPVDPDSKENLIVTATPKPKPPNWPLWFTIGGLLTLGSVVALFAAGGEAVRFAMLLLPISMYARVKRDRRRDDFVRGQIYGHILSNPGTTYSSIQRIVGVGNGTLSYHLYNLEREGFVKSVREGWFRRLYASGTSSASGAILSPLQSRIFEVVETNPGLSQSVIAMLLNVPRQNVNYNVMRLVNSGFLRVVGWGPKKSVYTVPEGPSFIVPADLRSPPAPPPSILKMAASRTAAPPGEGEKAKKASKPRKRPAGKPKRAAQPKKKPAPVAKPAPGEGNDGEAPKPAESPESPVTDTDASQAASAPPAATPEAPAASDPAKNP